VKAPKQKKTEKSKKKQKKSKKTTTMCAAPAATAESAGERLFRLYNERAILVGWGIKPHSDVEFTDEERQRAKRTIRDEDDPRRTEEIDRLMLVPEATEYLYAMWRSSCFAKNERRKSLETIGEIEAKRANPQFNRFFMQHLIGKVPLSIAAPLSELRPFGSFDEIPLHVRAADRYVMLIVRSSPVFEPYGLTFLASNVSTDGALIRVLLATPPQVTLADADREFYAGIVFAIKAPEMWLAISGSSRYIHVENHDDFVVVNSWDDALRGQKYQPCASALEWKERGNAFFKKGRASYAIACYSEGLKIEPAAIDLRSNRAQAFLSLGEWRQGLADADAVLALDPAHLKCTFRRADALHKLEMWTDAVPAWLAAAKLAEVGSADRARAQARAAAALTCTQHVKGVYDWRRIKSGGLKAADCGTFVHPAVALGMTPAHGRGLICREPIARGTVIIVEPPFFEAAPGAMVRDDKDATFEALDMVSCISALAEASHKDARMREKIESLSRARHPDFDAPYTRRLYAALSTNMWGSSTSCTILRWVSYFNHSCAPNCVSWKCEGLFVVKTIRDLQAGDELTVSYHGKTDDYETRTARNGRRLFVCDCCRCVEEKAGQDGYVALKAEFEQFRGKPRLWQSKPLQQLGARIDAHATARRYLDWRELVHQNWRVEMASARDRARWLETKRATLAQFNIDDPVDCIEAHAIGTKWLTLSKMCTDVNEATQAANESLAWFSVVLPKELVACEFELGK
jgi:tetratricopeptide (TPR) repeat protein